MNDSLTRHLDYILSILRHAQTHLRLLKRERVGVHVPDEEAGRTEDAAPVPAGARKGGDAGEHGGVHPPHLAVDQLLALLSPPLHGAGRHHHGHHADVEAHTAPDQEGTAEAVRLDEVSDDRPSYTSQAIMIY